MERGESDKKEVLPKEKLEKVDGVFDELLDKVKDAPEAKKRALEILIGQMNQIAGQMKEARDLRHLQEMKRQMLENWQELERLTGDDKELLLSVQNWGRKFNEEKILYYEAIKEIKTRIIERSQDIQTKWNEFQIELGKISHRIPGGVEFETGDMYGLETSYLDQFIESVIDISSGFEKDLDILSASQALSGIARLLRLASEAYEREGGNFDILKLKELADAVSAGIKDLTNTYNIVKK